MKKLEKYLYKKLIKNKPSTAIFTNENIKDLLDLIIFDKSRIIMVDDSTIVIERKK